MRDENTSTLFSGFQVLKMLAILSAVAKKNLELEKEKLQSDISQFLFVNDYDYAVRW